MTLLHETNFRTKKKKSCTLALQPSIPKISIYLFKQFYFFRFISTQFADFAFLKITNADNICKVIYCFKQRSLVSVANKHFDWLMIL